jgi:NADPH-dependent 2,4-dienoyl-CoA reductase/sulfur reductase-like enzyme
VGAVVVVGASLAGVSTIGALRQQGYDGPVVLVGDEQHHPYTRPPLSKAVLQGVLEPAATSLPALDDGVELILGDAAVSLDVPHRQVALASGRRLDFDQLVVATGSRARTLRPGGRGETVLRTLSDCIALRARLVDEQPSVAILGGGFLGLEIASTCRVLGLGVTVVDIVEPLERLLGPTLARRFRRAASEHGATLVTTPIGVELIGADPVTGLRLVDGSQISADLVLTAIGDVPNSEWLVGSGIAMVGGAVVIDSVGAAAPDIYAVGDVTVWHEADGAPRRRPHHSHAIDQARVAAHALLGGLGPAPIVHAPYFWTEMFGLDLRICGEIPISVEPTVLEGSLDAGVALLAWAVDGQAVAAAALNYKIPIPKLRKLLTAFGV